MLQFVRKIPTLLPSTDDCDQKAIIAVAHSLLVTIYHILRNRTDYSDLGADYFTKRNNEAAKRRSIKELERLGFKVLLEPVATALAVGA